MAGMKPITERWRYASARVSIIRDIFGGKWSTRGKIVSAEIKVKSSDECINGAAAWVKSHTNHSQQCQNFTFAFRQ